MKKLLLTLTVAFVFVSSCSPQHGPSGITNQQIGTVAGGVGGAYLGSNLGKGKGRTLGIATGTMLGALFGREIGASMDRADRSYFENTSQASLDKNEGGVTSKWMNPGTGNSGTITPTRSFQVNSGEYCREFTQTVVIGGERQEAYGTACRQSDGTWKLVN